MSSHLSRSRFYVTAGVLVAGLVLLHGVSHGEPVALRVPLRELPTELGQWRGQDDPLEQRIVEAVGVDDYLNRTYASTSGPPISLYVGYYRSQRTGDTVHSPKNCLPGTGWEPVRAGRLTVSVVNAQQITVNEYLVEKNSNRYLVLYWYQAHGRVVASEYSGKLWLVVDAIMRKRTDGAVVRVFTSARDGEENARARSVQFIEGLYPRLSSFIPD